MGFLPITGPTDRNEIFIKKIFLNFILCFFYKCIVLIGFLPREIWVAFPRESKLQQSHYPTYSAW